MLTAAIICRSSGPGNFADASKVTTNEHLESQLVEGGLLQFEAEKQGTGALRQIVGVLPIRFKIGLAWERGFATICHETDHFGEINKMVAPDHFAAFSKTIPGKPIFGFALKDAIRWIMQLRGACRESSQSRPQGRHVVHVSAYA